MLCALLYSAAVIAAIVRPVGKGRYFEFFLVVMFEKAASKVRGGMVTPASGQLTNMYSVFLAIRKRETGCR